VTFEDVPASTRPAGLQEIVEFYAIRKFNGRRADSRRRALVGLPAPADVMPRGRGEATFPLTISARTLSRCSSAWRQPRRDMFDRPRRYAPCTSSIDEIERGRPSSAAPASAAGNDEREQTLNQLLSRWTASEANEGVILIAATTADVLIPLLRPVVRPPGGGSESGRRRPRQILKVTSARCRCAGYQPQDHARALPLSRRRPMTL